MNVTNVISTRYEHLQEDIDIALAIDDIKIDQLRSVIVKQKNIVSVIQNLLIALLVLTIIVIMSVLFLSVTYDNLRAILIPISAIAFYIIILAAVVLLFINRKAQSSLKTACNEYINNFKNRSLSELTKLQLHLDILALNRECTELAFAMAESIRTSSEYYCRDEGINIEEEMINAAILESLRGLTPGQFDPSALRITRQRPGLRIGERGGVRRSNTPENLQKYINDALDRESSGDITSTECTAKILRASYELFGLVNMQLEQADALLEASAALLLDTEGEPFTEEFEQLSNLTNDLSGLSQNINQSAKSVLFCANLRFIIHNSLESEIPNTNRSINIPVDQFQQSLVYLSTILRDTIAAENNGEDTYRNYRPIVKALINLGFINFDNPNNEDNGLLSQVANARSNAQVLDIRRNILESLSSEILEESLSSIVLAGLSIKDRVTILVNQMAHRQRIILANANNIS